ncbi:MAG: DNA/RNA non-specific endonuclease [Planctomycetota bacterium]
MNRLIILVPALIGLSASSFSIPSGLQPLALDSFEQSVQSDIMKYGFPGTARLIFRKGYVLSYDGRNRTAHWVAERLSRDRLGGSATQRGLSFRIDRSVPAEHQSKNGDYLNSNLDRGHLAAAANHTGSADDVKETMIYSNASPQVGVHFNQGIWKWLEEDTREWAKVVDELYVYTGPIYRAKEPEEVVDPVGGRTTKWVRYQVIGDRNVAVPTHFFKVMLAEIDGKVAVQAFVLPNKAVDVDRDDVDWDGFLRSVDEVERRTGLDFFNVLSSRKQRELEKEVAPTAWSLAAPTN